MARQSLIWTCLPNGYTADGSALRLSLLLSPRLDPQGNPQRLDSFFPDWEDWPQTLAQANFTVACNGATVTVPGDGSGVKNRLDDRLGLADSATWRALFTPELYVHGYAFTDLSDHSVRSYDTLAILELVRLLYSNLALQADGNMPIVSDFVDSRDWPQIVGLIEHLDLQGKLPTLVAGADSSLQALAQLKEFHTPLAAPVVRKQARLDDPRIEATWQERNRPPMPKAEDLAKKLDFHQIVAAMGSYPTLLRRLGLVVDLLLAADSFPIGGDVDLSVQVVFPAGGLNISRGTDGAPVTRTLLSSMEFQAVSDPVADFPLKGRLLDLDPARFALLQADVDGAGLKLMNFARSLSRRGDLDARVDSVTRQEDELGAPALRTAGLMLVQRQRATWLSKRFVANKKSNSALETQMLGGPSTVSLHAEDLVRGYRIDIWDATANEWASLCRRTAHYELNDGAVVVESVPEEESTVRLAATTSADPTSNTDIISLHEALVTWSGWSLAAPPPGRAIRPDSSIDTTQDQSEAEVPPGLKFTSRFRAVKGSLPRLRFGRSYWIRARAVDLAGNSLDPQATDFADEQPSAHAQPFRRYEPVAGPVLGLVSQSGTIETPGAGESMNRIAVRSFNDTPTDNVIPSAETAHRAALPPRVSAREAEQHGMLDSGGRVDTNTFAMLAHDKDLDGRDKNAVLREVQLPTQGPLGSAPADTTFAVHEVGRSMTYLPDPIASNIAVRIFDHPNIDASEIITIPFYPDSAWPQAQPFLVEAYEGGGEKPHFELSTRTLRIPLPKAVRAFVRLSAKLDDSALTTMGVFAWLDAAGQAAQRKRAQDGQHWMLTPWQVLELVHAVQRPLKVPDISHVSILPRVQGDTHAFPVMLVQCSIASTDRLDLLAEWHEPTPSAATPTDRKRSDAAFHVKVTDDKSYATVIGGNPAGGYPDHTMSGPDLLGVNALMDPSIASKAHEFHDSRYRRIEYWFDATTRFREFLPTSLLTRTGPSGPIPTDENIKVTGARSVTWIPSSMPPPAPTVLYVLPTFGWARDRDSAGNAVSRRRGGGIRIYLDQPWNISGYGEMLAVVLPPADFAGDPDTMPKDHPLRKYATLWGNDPVWGSAFVSGIAPKRTDFTLARWVPDPQGAWLPLGAPPTESDQPPGAFKVSGLRPPASASYLTLEVAPHDVFWDPDRQLWYCDVEVDPGGAYFPFIRLALARYQPASIDGAHLSNVVLADFMALAPERWLVVATTPDPRTVQVTVSGLGYSSSSGWQEATRTAALANAVPAKTSVVQIWVEYWEPRLGSDFGWQSLVSAVVTPVVGTVAPGGSAEVLWNGQVTVPAGDGRQHRLVVAEYEEYVVDGVSPYNPPPTQKGRRLVFVEHYSLDL
jgi:hypothetical protein